MIPYKVYLLPFIDWKSRSVMKGMAMLEFSLCLLSFTVLLESPTHSPVAKKRLEISKRLSESINRRRTDNIMVKRKEKWSTKNYTIN
jgi:hypothetical protein